jgi:hypothetical protein
VQVPGSGSRISVAKITGQGLTSIAILVALLWTCLICQRVTLGRANADAEQVMRGMRDLRLKRLRQPAAAPARAPQRRRNADIG